LKKRMLAAVAAAAAASALALTGCSGSSPASSDAASAGAGAKTTLTLFTDSDVGIQQLWQNSLIPSFEASHPNITLKFSAADTTNDSAQLAKLSASVKQKKAAPMDVIVDAGFISNASSAGLLEDVSAKTVPNLKNIESVMTAQQGELPYRASAVVLAYNSKKVPNPPTTLTGLVKWIKANPGQFTYNSPSTGGSGQGFVQAVLDSNLSTAQVKKLSTGSDASAQDDWSKGLQTLAGLTPSIYQKTYPNGNQAALDLLGQGQISMVPSWSDIFLTTKKAGGLTADDKVVSITDPAMPGGPSYLAVTKSSAHKEAANELLNWVLEPAQQAQIVTQVNGFPVIPTAKLPESTQSAFSGIDTTKQAPFYSASSASDMNSQWQKIVP
jgi:putative spermidine/putrescine transport system substrate-binding protein